MRKMFYYFLFITIILQSCDPVANFSKAQPSGVAALKKIPTSLRGFYITVDSSALLSVGPTSMILNYNKKDRDTTNQDVRDVLADKLSNSIIREDTILALSPRQVLKKYRGNYIISTQNDNGWEVMLVALRKNKLSFSHLNSKEALEKLPTIKASVTDTTKALYSPSRKQFLQLLKDGAFSPEDTFFRVRKKLK